MQRQQQPPRPVVFFSNNCQHCQRLITFLENNNINLNTFQFVSVDNPNVQIPPQIQSVPALILNGEVYQGNPAMKAVQQIVHNILQQAQQRAAMQQQQQFNQQGMGQMMQMKHPQQQQPQQRAQQQMMASSQQSVGGGMPMPNPRPQMQPPPEKPKEPECPEGICEFDGQGSGGLRFASADDKAINLSDNVTYSFINGNPNGDSNHNQSVGQQHTEPKKPGNDKADALNSDMEKLMTERANFSHSLTSRSRVIT